MFGDTVVACLLATTVAFGLSAGMSDTAVSTLSVLAGRYQPCGSLAASTWPVPASATTNAEAAMSGSRGTGPDGSLTTTPREASCGPPTAWATGDREGPPRTAADAGTGAVPSTSRSVAHTATRIRSSMSLPACPGVTGDPEVT